MDFDTARQLYEQIEISKLQQPKTDLLLAAIRYARIRADWQLASPEERHEMNQHRTVVHNALIDACNILSRHMAAAGEGNAWRAALGDDRKNIGDFACFVHCFLGLAS